MNNNNYLVHHGVKGQKHGVRQWQYKDGSLTPAGRIHYGVGQGRKSSSVDKKVARKMSGADFDGDRVKSLDRNRDARNTQRVADKKFKDKFNTDEKIRQEQQRFLAWNKAEQEYQSNTDEKKRDALRQKAEKLASEDPFNDVVKELEDEFKKNKSDFNDYDREMIMNSVMETFDKNIWTPAINNDSSIKSGVQNKDSVLKRFFGATTKAASAGKNQAVMVLNKMRQKKNEAKEKAEQDKQERAERTKEEILSSGDANEILKISDKLTTQELNDAVNRVQKLQQLRTQATNDEAARKKAEEENSKINTLARFVTKAATTAETIGKGIETYKKFKKILSKDDSGVDDMRISDIMNNLDNVTVSTMDKIKAVVPAFNTLSNLRNNASNTGGGDNQNGNQEQNQSQSKKKNKTKNQNQNGNQEQTSTETVQNTSASPKQETKADTTPQKDVIIKTERTPNYSEIKKDIAYDSFKQTWEKINSKKEKPDYSKMSVDEAYEHLSSYNRQKLSDTDPHVSEAGKDRAAEVLKTLFYYSTNL